MNTYSQILCTKTSKKFGIVKGKEYPVAQITEHSIYLMQNDVAVPVPVEYFLQ